jgi:competence protein CoiA
MKMKFAVVGEERREAQRGLSAVCPVCDAGVIAKCGDVRVWHWAHRGRRTCDHWWESETPWHRAWKGEFPERWQEVIQRAQSGEKHIADVKTENGVVLEFQHSFLRPDEREARESFYGNMIWVVDGLRLKGDRAQFFASLGAATVVELKPLTFSFPSNKSALLRDWTGRRVPVFFDFGHRSELGDALGFDEPVLWRLCPRSANGMVHVSPVPRTSFLRNLKGLPLKGIDHSAAAPALLALTQQRAASSRAIGFQKYVLRKEEARRRARF